MSEILIDAILGDLLDRYGMNKERLQSFGFTGNLCVRTLIQELHALDEAGALKAATQKEKYQYYEERYLQDPAYVEDLFTRYPVLETCLTEEIERTAAFYQQVQKRLEEDWPELTRSFCRGARLSDVTAIKGNLSDRHRGGTGVLEIVLKNGTSFFYKPHSLENEKIFQELYSGFCQYWRIPIPKLKILNKGTYGWEEKIVLSECTSLAAVERYYRRAGILVFLTYLLGAGDMHCENLLAQGEYPRIVDAEVFSKPVRPTGEEDLFAQMQRRLQFSVLGTGMLPFLHWSGAGGGVNMSALGARGSQKCPFQVPKVADPFTSDMRIVYSSPTMESEENQPRFQGKEMPVEDYEEALLQGFGEAYELAMAHRKALLAYAGSMGRMESRYLCRDTQIYAMLLNSSYHPSLLQRKGDREAFLGRLAEQEKEMSPKVQFCLEQEQEELKRGDIPYFSYKLGSRTLYSGTGACYPDFFEEPAQRLLEKRIESLSVRDFIRQSRLITMSLSLLSPEKLYNRYCRQEEVGGMVQGRYPVELALQALKAQILESMERSEDGEKVGFVGVLPSEASEGGWGVRPCGFDLYQGTLGIHLFLQALQQQYPDPAIAEILAKLEGMLQEHVEQTFSCRQKPASVGVFDGEGGVLYLCLLLFQMTGRQEFLEAGKRQAAYLDGIWQEYAAWDVISGKAGLLMLYLHVYELTGENAYLGTVRQLADALIGQGIEEEGRLYWLTSEKEALGGFSHGTSGVATALGRLVSVSGEQKYREALKKVLAYDNSLYLPEAGNWKDLRSFTGEETGKLRTAAAWCHGSAGILLSRLCLAQEDLGERTGERIRKDIERAASSLIACWQREGNCLCHGNSGNLWILQRYGVYAKDVEVEEFCQKGRDALIADLAEERQRLPQEKYHPGLMMGAAGIGYYLLRGTDPGLPDLLALEL